MIIGIAGPAGAGKDTVADFLVANYGFTKVSWAGPLKAGLAAMGFPEPADREMKEHQIPGFDFSWRQAAQTLGTEWGRALDPDIWVKLVGDQLRAEPGRNWVISDVRFENEAAMVRSLGGFILGLVGRSSDLGAASSHASEAGLLTHAPSDWVIANNFGYHELYGDVREMLYVKACHD